MTAAIFGFTFIRLIASDGTPDEFQEFDQVVIAGPSDIFLTLGSGPDHLGTLAGISGYPLKNNEDPLTTTHFMMVSTTAVMKTFIDGLMPNGWQDPAQSSRVQQVAKTLSDAGLNDTQIRSVLDNVVSATQQDVVQQVFTAGIEAE